MAVQKGYWPLHIARSRSQSTTLDRIAFVSALAASIDVEDFKLIELVFRRSDGCYANLCSNE
jgi:hypothetical protein